MGHSVGFGSTLYLSHGTGLILSVPTKYMTTGDGWGWSWILTDMANIFHDLLHLLDDGIK